MTTRKRWLSQVSMDSIDTIPESQEISWSSSESDTETNFNFSFKRKLDSPDGAIASTSKIIRLQELVNEGNSESLVDILPEFSSIISKTLESSPILIRQVTVSPQIINISPVIGRHGLVRNSKGYKRNLSNSADIFGVESQNILNAVSPEHIVTPASQKISPVYSQKVMSQSQKFSGLSNGCVSLESDLSNQKETTFARNDSSESTSGKSDNSSLIPYPVTSRKKYKKGGLAALLQKTIRLQKSRFAIWQHEICVKKLDNVGDGQIISFKVLNIKKEYGATVLECLVLNDSEHVQDQYALVAVTVSCYFELTIGYRYKIFPPYQCKNINYRGSEICFYYNVDKIIFYKD